MDKGIANVIVRAYDSSGILQGTATTLANGSYTLNMTGTGPYRLEFDTSTFPSNYQSGPVGANNGSTVRFIPNGNATGIDLGIALPTEYCQNNPLLAVSCFAKDNAESGPYSGATTLYSFLILGGQ